MLLNFGVVAELGTAVCASEVDPMYVALEVMCPCRISDTIFAGKRLSSGLVLSDAILMAAFSFKRLLWNFVFRFLFRFGGNIQLLVLVNVINFVRVCFRVFAWVQTFKMEVDTLARGKKFLADEALPSFNLLF